MILRRIPSLPTWSAGFRELDEARRDMERVFNSLTGLSGVPSTGVFPAINVSEDPETIYVRAELPGINKDDLELALKLKEIGYRQSLLDKTALLEKEIQTLQKEVKALQKTSSASPAEAPATQPPSPASPKPVSEIETNKPTPREPGGIVEQTIE